MKNSETKVHLFNVKDYLMLLVGVAIYGLFALLPLRTHALTVLTLHPLSDAASCVSLRSESLMQCTIWSVPPHTYIAWGITGISLFILLGLVTIRHSWASTSFEKIKRFALIGIITSITAVVFFNGAGVIARRHLPNFASAEATVSAQLQFEQKRFQKDAIYCNQPQTTPQSACTATTQLGRAVQTLQAAHYAALQQTVPTYGLTPVFMVAISCLYILAPLLNYYRTLSPRYIRGHRKESLFL